MDPDAALQIIRDAIHEADTTEPGLHGDAVALDALRAAAEHFQALDEWLSVGGLPPSQWRHQ